MKKTKLSNKLIPFHGRNIELQSTAIKMFSNSNTSMALELRERAYTNERTLGRATFVSNAKRIPRKQSLWNQLEVLRELKFGWINIKNDDILRVEFKKQFIVFWFLTILSQQLPCTFIYYNLMYGESMRLILFCKQPSKAFSLSIKVFSPYISGSRRMGVKACTISTTGLIRAFLKISVKSVELFRRP